MIYIYNPYAKPQ